MELIYVGSDKSNILLTKCTPVVSIETEVKPYVDEMIKIAVENNLIGLSANQVGLTSRFFIMMGGNGWQVVVNPELKGVKDAGRKWDWEGCGSVKNMEFLVERWNKIKCSWYNRDNEKFSDVELIGFLARVFQHETDHLNSILVMNKARQRRIIK